MMAIHGEHDAVCSIDVARDFAAQWASQTNRSSAPFHFEELPYSGHGYSAEKALARRQALAQLAAAGGVAAQLPFPAAVAATE